MRFSRTERPLRSMITLLPRLWTVQQRLIGLKMVVTLKEIWLMMMLEPRKHQELPSQEMSVLTNKMKISLTQTTMLKLNEKENF